MANISERAKEIIKSNKALLQQDNFDKFFKEAGGYGAECFAFFVDTCGVNPLDFMKTVSTSDLFNATLKSITIPNNISSVSSDAFGSSTQIGTLINNSDCSIDFKKAREINNIIINGNISRLTNKMPKGLKTLQLPASCKSISAHTFDNCTDVIITTPYRESASDKMRLPESEIPWYKEHLKFTHAEAKSDAE